jgi:hypothetical protein
MAQTIQESLVDCPSANGQATRYLDTVQAYDQWVEVLIYMGFVSVRSETA